MVHIFLSQVEGLPPGASDVSQAKEIRGQVEDSVLTFFIVDDDAPVESEYRGTLSAAKDTLWLENIAIDRGGGASPYVRPPDDEGDS